MNCAIALAVMEIAPNAQVYCNIDWGFGTSFPSTDSPLPDVAWNFIQLFDSLESTPEKRLKLPEISFEVDFPDELVEKIGIDEVKNILSKSDTLAMVE